ncbi:unnamed protein product [Hydatigera taeniaeformis]|uniref:Uncharacterized protein n=1 Tax=Hydatigena taeniaeformis TaxID=6205 RepID=A0A0R3WSJ8_HYDTA|nr:unnamed protein product [Hydatigera taeniaeformis]
MANPFADLQRDAADIRPHRSSSRRRSTNQIGRSAHVTPECVNNNNNNKNNNINNNNNNICAYMHIRAQRLIHYWRITCLTTLSSRPNGFSRVNTNIRACLAACAIAKLDFEHPARQCFTVGCSTGHD